MNSLKELTPYFSILKEKPLHIAIMFLATLMSTLFISIQPMFIKTFLNAISSSEETGFMLVILSFAGVSLCMAYLFDFISVSFRFLIKYNFDLFLFKTFTNSSMSLSEEAFEFGLTDGLDRISNSVLKVTLDFFHEMLKVFLIIIFLGTESLQFAIGTFCIFLLGVGVSSLLINRIAKILRYEVLSIESLARQIRSQKREKLKYRFLRFNYEKFGIKSFIYVITYLIFQLLPIFFLFYYTFDKFVSIGSITSILIYIGMLHGPYKNLVEIIKELKVTVKVTSFIRKDFEAYLKFLEKTKDLDKGIIFIPDSTNIEGVSLNDSNPIQLVNSCLFSLNSLENKNMDEILKRGEKEKIFILTKFEEHFRNGHFVYQSKIDEIGTVLPYLQKAIA